MTKLHSSPLHSWWTLKKIAPELQQLNEIPLFGESPPFDWDLFSSELKERLAAAHLSIEPGMQRWLLPSQLQEGLGPDVIIFPIDIAPLHSPAYWLMSRQDSKKLTSLLFTKRSTDRLQLGAGLLQEGFYRYLLLEAISIAVELEPLQTFTPILHEEAPLPHEKAFGIDILIRCADQGCSGRLLIPNELRTHWIKHFDKSRISAISPRLLQSVEVAVAIKMGSVELLREEWAKVKMGDCILLDAGSYDPRHDEGIASLTLGTTSLFHVRPQKNGVQLIDYAFIYEDPTDMPTHDESLEQQTPEAEAIGIKETPMHITVELARLRMPLEKLMQLTPGNLLELPIEPDQDVTLSVNGQRIGKAELVYLGERLGVRITQLG